MSKLNQGKSQKPDQKDRKNSKLVDNRKPVKKHKAKLKPEKLKYRNFNKWIEDDDMYNSIFQEE